MLLLVLADRHMGRAVDQNVGGHQVRIGVQADRDVLAILAGLLLELGHAVEPAEARDAIEHPGELGVLGDLALVEDDLLLGIDAAGDEGRGHLARGPRQLARVLPHRDGVQVDHAIDAVVALLQRDELGDRAEIIAEVQVAGRLHAGKHAFLERHGRPSRDCGGPHRMTPFGAQPLLRGRNKGFAPIRDSNVKGVSPVIRYRRRQEQSGICAAQASGGWDLDEQRRADHPIGESGARHSNRRLLSRGGVWKC